MGPLEMYLDEVSRNGISFIEIFVWVTLFVAYFAMLYKLILAAIMFSCILIAAPFIGALALFLKATEKVHKIRDLLKRKADDMHELINTE